MFNSTLATVSTYEEEGLPAWKPAKRCCTHCSLGRTSSKRCRCACSRTPRAVSAAIVLITPPSHRCSRTGHCSCSRCSGRRDPSRATSRAETQRSLRSRRMPQAPRPCTLLRFARMRRCARPRHRLRCGAACRRCRCFGGLGCTDRALHVGRDAALSAATSTLSAASLRRTGTF